MATKKYLELQEYPDADLKAELAETEAQYQKLKFDHAIRGLDNPISLREIRRDIARLKTEIRRRELAQATADELNGRARIRQRRRAKK
jgi:large subunit ribosomal protein L29